MTIESTSGSEDKRLEALQETLRDALGETSFGAPTKATVPGGQTIVFRRRQYDGRPDPVDYTANRADQRKAVSKRSKAMGESWKKFVEPGKRSLVERKDDSVKGKFPLAYELVEYVNGGGTVNNVARMMQLKPPTIHGIEDVADAVDWHFLNRGITVEHLETGLSKDGSKILVFMDDRAAPRLPQVKEVLSKFGEARILQRADDMSEQTNQPHGFYVFELSPDKSGYQPREKALASKTDLTWNPDTAQPDMVDSLDDDTVEVILEDVFEPFCSTCGDQLFESSAMRRFKPSEALKRKAEADKAKRKAGTVSWKNTDFSPKGVYDSLGEADAAAKKNDPNKDDDYDDKDGEDEFSDYKSSEAFDARVGDPKGKKKKDHKSTIGDSLDYRCGSCATDATPLDEHEFQGYFCARHGDRLDKFSRTCNECKEDARFEENVVVACPDCKSNCSLDESSCNVCGTIFDEGISDYAEYIAEELAPLAVDENITLSEHDWTDSYATKLADTLFADVVEDDSLPF